MTQQIDKVTAPPTTVLMSPDIHRRAKIFAATTGTNIRALVDEGVSALLDRKSAAAAPSLQETPVAAKG